MSVPRNPLPKAPPEGELPRAAEGETPTHAVSQVQVLPSPSATTACPPKVRVAGPYQIALADDGPPVMFDVPAGPNLEIVRHRVNQPDGNNQRRVPV